MWGPYREAVAAHLPNAEVVYDKFHVMQHVGRAVDETRRAEFFRQGAEARAAMRGKRWLLLSRWKNLAREGRRRLAEALDLNRRLFKAYYLKEEIHQLWDYTYPGAAIRFWENWKKSLRWQRLPAFERLVATIEKHLAGILAHCRHKVRFGVVESINAIVKSIIRRARGYRDHAYVRLKIMWATAHPTSKASL
jgi:transposase